LHGNWIKKTTFYNKIPVNIIYREIIYFDDATVKNPPLVHPLSIATEVEAEKVIEPVEELSDKKLKWLIEGSPTSDGFSAARYYAIQHKEAPSLISYTGPYIEAINLRNELIENMDAQEIHTYEVDREEYGNNLNRFTLIFPGKAYILQALGISKMDAWNFEVPDNIETEDGDVYISQFQLYRPSPASGKRDEYFEEEIREYISLCTLKTKPELPTINMIEVSSNGFVMAPHDVDQDFEIKDLDVNYGYGFSKFHEELMGRFNNSTKGLVLFHGIPGTGKTYYIRHLLREMATGNKEVIYMPPNMVDHLVEPGFMTFLSGEVREWSEEGKFCVLLIEDAEPLLAKRQEGVRIQGVTNLLNMTDGLLNDMLNLQIICTFNVDLKKLDSALLRPGRLIARKEFKALSELDANLLAQRLGIKHHFTKPATLGEIYSWGQNKHTLIHDVEADRDASSLIDDL